MLLFFMFRCSLALNAILISQVTDKRSVEFVDRLSQIFEGRGELLGGETKPSRLVPTNLKDCERGRDGAVTQETTQHLPGGAHSLSSSLIFFLFFKTCLVELIHCLLHSSSFFSSRPAWWSSFIVFFTHLLSFLQDLPVGAHSLSSSLIFFLFFKTCLVELIHCLLHSSYFFSSRPAWWSSFIVFFTHLLSFLQDLPGGAHSLSSSLIFFLFFMSVFVISYSSSS